MLSRVWECDARVRGNWSSAVFRALASSCSCRVVGTDLRVERPMIAKRSPRAALSRGCLASTLNVRRSIPVSRVAYTSALMTASFSVPLRKSSARRRRGKSRPGKRYRDRVRARAAAQQMYQNLILIQVLHHWKVFYFSVRKTILILQYCYKNCSYKGTFLVIMLWLYSIEKKGWILPVPERLKGWKICVFTWLDVRKNKSSKCQELTRVFRRHWSRKKKILYCLSHEGSND